MVIKVDQVQNIFDQEGCIEGKPVKIYLREDMKPYCVTSAIWITFPLLVDVETVSISLSCKNRTGTSRRGYNRKSHQTDRLVRGNCSSKEKKWTCAFMC